MSYDIYIGNAEITDDFQDDPDENGLGLRVRSMTMDEAPEFPNDVMSAHVNNRHPGYSQWAKFTELVDLDNLFWDKYTGLMREHPGTFRLRQSDLVAIKTARAILQKEHPEAVPQFSDDIWDNHHQRLGIIATEYDSALARLLWLEWWVDWALNNCAIPAIHNH